MNWLKLVFMNLQNSSTFVQVIESTKKQQGRKTIFLDRDGTINREVEYLSRVEDVEILPGVVEAIRAFKEAGYLVFIVSNQGGIAKKKLTIQDYIRVTAEIINRLASKNAIIDGTRYCPHHPEGLIPELSIPCLCRKPEPGMILELAQQYSVSLSESWMIGDKAIDIEAGFRVGCKTLMVQTGYGISEQKKLANMGISKNFYGVFKDLEKTINVVCV